MLEWTLRGKYLDKNESFSNCDSAPVPADKEDLSEKQKEILRQLFQILQFIYNASLIPYVDMIEFPKDFMESMELFELSQREWELHLQFKKNLIQLEMSSL